MGQVSGVPAAVTAEARIHIVGIPAAQGFAVPGGVQLNGAALEHAGAYGC